MRAPRANTPAPYNIGEVAERSGVSAKMVRHYEAIGLIGEATRSSGNYRLYRDTDVHSLSFIRRARALGFSMKQIGVLLSLWRDRRRSSAHVRRLATAHIEELQRKIRELESMVHTLQHLVEHCHGDERPECPILEDLASSDGRSIKSMRAQS